VECENEKPQELRSESSPGSVGKSSLVHNVAEEFPGDAGGLCSRGGWEERVGNERFFCSSLSIVAKL
jgi:hypothetical protein